MSNFGPIRSLVAAFCLAVTAASAASVQADDGVVVVELFTSQGCSSCPPADAYLGRLAEREDVIALALHVDYWDYIGWKDDMANPAHTERQKDYARVAGKRMVYTPQMIVGGRDHVTGHDPAEVEALIRRHKAAPHPVALEAVRRGDRINITVQARSTVGRTVVNAVRYIPNRSVEITKGENRGRTLDYHNSVTDFARVGRWDGRGTFTATIRVNDDQPVAVIVQTEGPGPVLAAVKVD